MHHERLVGIIKSLLGLLSADFFYGPAIVGLQDLKQLLVSAMPHYEALPSRAPKSLILDRKDRRHMCPCPRLVAEHQRPEAQTEDRTHRPRRLLFGIETFFEQGRRIRIEAPLPTFVRFTFPSRKRNHHPHGGTANGRQS